ncbi:MAG: hypothetical protein HY072_00210 [Deltaproteobacteria bacterium]|nr:hypothetical protein [Deltaproteobacteria bacterium]
MHVFNQIILVLAMIFVLSCSQQFQITTKLSANISDPVFTPDNNTTTSQILSPTKQNLSIIKSQNICMNNAGLSVSAGELFFDVKQYIKGQQEGISVRVHKQFNLLPGWYDITPLSEESTEESRKPVLIFDQPDINRNNLQDLINKKRLELDLTSLEDGNYSLHVYTPGNRHYVISPSTGS